MSNKFFDALFSFFTHFFGKIFEEIKQFFLEQLQDLGEEIVPKLADPQKLYYELNIEKTLIRFLKSIDRNPKDNNLDLIPWIPERLELIGATEIAKRVFVFACVQLREEIEEGLLVLERGKFVKKPQKQARIQTKKETKK